MPSRAWALIGLLTVLVLGLLGALALLSKRVAGLGPGAGGGPGAPGPGA
ncbi:MAG: hypothetical protein M3Q27_19350 [Actinomycetota bacterium]|nr:hypothetical protein [Actinomycetota bacterium]